MPPHVQVPGDMGGASWDGIGLDEQGCLPPVLSELEQLHAIYDAKYGRKQAERSPASGPQGPGGLPLGFPHSPQTPSPVKMQPRGYPCSPQARDETQQGDVVTMTHEALGERGGMRRGMAAQTAGQSAAGGRAPEMQHGGQHGGFGMATCSAEDEPADTTPIELRGLPVYEGPGSLLDALLFHGLPGLCFADMRRLAQASKTRLKLMDDDEVWRLAGAAVATQCGLYAPAASVHWKKLFLETLWPARSKWRGVESSESLGFRIRVAVRVRPRKHDASRHDGLVLPLHQRLKLLKKGQKLGSLDDERGGATQEQLAEALKGQGDLSPELLEALMEAQQLAAVMNEAAAQERGGPKGGKDIQVEAGSGAAAAVEQAAASAGQATTLTDSDHKYLQAAEKEAKEKRKENQENGDGVEKKANGSKLLLVQPSRVVMFVPGCGLRPFHFPTVCDDKVAQPEVYQRVAQDAVCSALNGMNACVLAYGQTGSGKTHTVFVTRAGP